MTIKKKEFTKGIRLREDSDALTQDGEMRNDGTELKVHADGSERSVATTDQSQTLSNKTIDSANNTITVDADEATVSNLEVDNLKAGVLDTDLTAVSASHDTIPSAKATKDYVDAQILTKDEASEIAYDDTGNTKVVGADVQAALDAADSEIATNATDIGTNATNLSNHLADTVDAHDASAISYVNTTSGLTATDAQAAIDEVEGRLDTAESNISTNASDLSTHTGASSGVHGVTGNVVGTTDTQTLQNKTLDSTNTFSGAVDDPTKLEVKQDTEANLETYATTANNGQLVFATDTKKMYQIIDNELKAVGGGATSIDINQTTHGFALGDGIYHNGTSWAKAQADADSTLATYVVTEVPDVDNFIATNFGRIEATAHGFTVGQYYFLSTSVAGQPTTTEPTSGYSNPLFFVESANFLQIFVYRPSAVSNTLNLDELSDVSVPSPTDGQGLVYVNAASRWEAVDVATQAEIDAHTSATSAHGVTGDIVGTSDTQTLSNKTLGSTNTFSGSVESPTRLDVKKDTQASLETYAGTASDGQVVFATDDKKFYGIKDNELVSLGGGVSSPSIFGILNADDDKAADFTTSGGTMSEETTNQLNGDKSFKFAPSAVSDETESPAVTIPLRSKDAGTVVTEFVYNATHDGFRAEIRDDSDNVLATSDLLASETKVQMFYNLIGTETSLNFAIVDATHTASMEIVFDDVVFDDEPFRKIDTIETGEYLADTLAGSFGSTNTKIPYYTSVITDEANGLFAVEQSSTLGMSITALRDCRIYTQAISKWGGTGESFGFTLNSTELTTNIQNLTNTEDITSLASGVRVSASANVLVKKGDVIRPHVGNIYSQTDQQGLWNVRVHAVAINESVVVENADGSEWTDAGAINLTASGGGLSKGTTSIDRVLWRRVGDSMELRYEYQQTTDVGALAGTGTYLFGIPAGYSIDTTKVTVGTGDGAMAVGHGYPMASSTDGREGGRVIVYDANNLAVSVQADPPSASSNFISSSYYSTGGATRGYTLVATVPIEGWSATEAHIIPIADPYENEYSVRFNSSGVVVSEKYSGTFTATNPSTGVYTIDYSSLNLTVAPAVNAIVEIVGSFGRNVDIDVATTTSVTIRIDNGGAAQNQAFNFFLSRQGADVREPKGYFIGQSVPMRTAYVKDITASGAGSSSTLSGGSWTDMALNTVEGDSGFLSLSSNTITLSEGTYEIESIVPYCVNDSTFISYQGHHRIRNITASTTPATSTHFGARAGGNTAGHRQCSDTTAKTRIVLTASADFKIQAYINNSTSTGIGSDAGSGENNTHTTVKITKVK